MKYLVEVQVLQSMAELAFNSNLFKFPSLSTSITEHLWFLGGKKKKQTTQIFERCPWYWLGFISAKALMCMFRP